MDEDDDKFAKIGRLKWGTSEVQAHSVKFVFASDLVPGPWVSWFWETISEGAPFSWGDNNLSLVKPEDFARHVERMARPSTGVVSQRALITFLNRVRALPADVYINLEGRP